MLAIITAIVSGALMSIQGVFNEGVTKQTSVWVSASFVQLTALLFCLAAWLFTGKEGVFSSLFKIDNKYMLLGGIIGALITYTVIKSMAGLGPAQAVMIIVTAQLLVAYLIELFGLFGVEKVNFQWQKLIGVIISIGGILLFKWEFK
jgi:transporter family-2 protein